ncbi:MAG: AAA family ATPase [Chloroflexi bacterium]|nr:AAA family ATPase [Chloroflexota bacterium]
MLTEVMKHFNLAIDFQDAGYFETETHKAICREITEAIKLGRLVAVSGIVGSGKTTILKKVQDKLKNDKDILISKSLSLEKEKVTLTMLIMALFYDLSTGKKETKIPRDQENRSRKLRALIRKRQKPVALFVDEAHDLNPKTMVGLKRLVESIRDVGCSLSIVLAGHPKLQNDLRRPAFEEIGARTTTITLDGITAVKREYIVWLFERCLAKGTKPDSIITDNAIDLLADRLMTPLQIHHYIILAFEQAFSTGIKPVTQEIVNSVIAQDINNLEPRLIRYGYSVKAIADNLSVRPKMVRLFLKGQLPNGQAQEIQKEMLSMGIPL